MPELYQFSRKKVPVADYILLRFKITQIQSDQLGIGLMKPDHGNFH